jgi:ribonuclease P protein subunit RPR2
MVIKKSGTIKKIAAERIEILYKLAKEEYNTDPKLSKQYAKLIKQISRHYKIKLDKEIKHRICKKCGSFLVPGANLTVKIVSSRHLILYKCKDCGAETKIPY